MKIEDNPYINPPSHFSGYQDSIDKFQETSKQVELDRLCFDVFVSNDKGRQLLEILNERYVKAATPFKIGPDYKYACIYYEGLRQAYRALGELAATYKHRKESEALKAEIDTPTGGIKT